MSGRPWDYLGYDGRNTRGGGLDREVKEQKREEGGERKRQAVVSIHQLPFYELYTLSLPEPLGRVYYLSLVNGTRPCQLSVGGVPQLVPSPYGNGGGDARTLNWQSYQASPVLCHPAEREGKGVNVL